MVTLSYVGRFLQRMIYPKIAVSNARSTTGTTTGDLPNRHGRLVSSRARPQCGTSGARLATIELAALAAVAVMW